MDKILERIEGKLDRVSEEQHKLAITCATMAMSVTQNTKDVAEHIRRTQLLENRVDVLEEPGIVRKHLWKWATGAIVILSGLVGIAVKLGWI